MGYCLDIPLNSHDLPTKKVWSSVRRISFQILDVKGLNTERKRKHRNRKAKRGNSRDGRAGGGGGGGALARPQFFRKNKIKTY